MRLFLEESSDKQAQCADDDRKRCEDNTAPPIPIADMPSKQTACAKQDDSQ
jgi:hypothetical protein